MRSESSSRLLGRGIVNGDGALSCLASYTGLTVDPNDEDQMRAFLTYLPRAIRAKVYRLDVGRIVAGAADQDAEFYVRCEGEDWLYVVDRLRRDGFEPGDWYENDRKP